jgi:membrane associated rhomboid family serine protease
MFLFAPTGNGLRLRAVPVATAVLAALQLVVAAWTLPQIERARVACDADALPHSVSRTGSVAAVATRTAATSELQALNHAARDAERRAVAATDPTESWGYRRGSVAWRAVSALFVHADALHLVANLIFLLVAGAFLEQVWSPGRVFALYILAGPAALMLESSIGPADVVLGSSGAVAALLGACCVLFQRRPVRCAYVYFEYLRPRRGRFEIPASLLAGAWVVQQLVGAAVSLVTGDYSIAYVSHLGGFALGALAALVAQRLDLRNGEIPAAAGPVAAVR